MKHYEFFKLTPDADVVKVQQKVWKALQKLDDELDWLNRPVVYRNCLSKPGSPDLMAVIDLDGEELLEQYLEHPTRQKLAEHLKDVVVSEMAFDHY